MDENTKEKLNDLIDKVYAMGEEDGGMTVHDACMSIASAIEEIIKGE